MNPDTMISTEVCERAGVPIVDVTGEVDLYTVSEFEHAMHEGINKAKRALIVDLSKLTYLDSAGLAALLNAYRTLDARGVELVVVAPPGKPGVCRVLEITRFDTFIRVRPTIEQALSDLHMPAAA